MKPNFKAAAVQMDCVLNQKEQNLAAMEQWIARACEDREVKLVVFPELTVSGYIPECHTIEANELFITMAEPVPGPSTERIGELARRYGAYVVFGLPESCEVPGIVYNTVVLIGPNGALIGKHRKLHIPFDENHYFRAGDRIVTFDTDLGRIGLVICYDISFMETARAMTLQGAELLIGIANWPEFVGERSIAATWDHFPDARAAENQLYFIACNKTGAEGTQKFYGHSKIIRPDGAVVSASEGYEETLVIGDIEMGKVAQERGFFPFLGNRRPDVYGKITEVMS